LMARQLSLDAESSNDVCFHHWDVERRDVVSA
jgi:hypothetical protein